MTNKWFVGFAGLTDTLQLTVYLKNNRVGWVTHLTPNGNARGLGRQKHSRFYSLVRKSIKCCPEQNLWMNTERSKSRIVSPFLCSQNNIRSSGHIRKVRTRWLTATTVTLFRTFYQPCVRIFNASRYEEGYLTEVGWKEERRRDYHTAASKDANDKWKWITRLLWNLEQQDIFYILQNTREGFKCSR